VYHGRLDERPTAITVRVSWQGPQEPTEVFVERKSHKQTAKGYEEMQERMTLPENMMVGYLEGDFGVDAAQEFWQKMVRFWKLAISLTLIGWFIIYNKDLDL
jgi:SPX domain protein involved in polyphosphate accumulation